MSIHKDHRKRMRERFMLEGMDHFSDVQALEMLLFYAIPRRDTNEIAHGLIEHFGGLVQVLEATPEELAKVPGMGEHSAVLLSMILPLGRMYDKERTKPGKILDTIDKCGRHLMPYFRGKRNETVYLLCLDAKCKLLGCRLIGEGSVNSAGVPVRRVVETALSLNATSVVLAHNHPSGIAVPSGEDVVATERVAAALNAVEIILVDHLVFSDDDYVSHYHSGMYRPGEVSLE